MLERIKIRNFKQFDDVVIELGQRVVFVGPNDSGKTSALQALALWELGLRRWVEKRGHGPTPKKCPGVTINRQELLSLPVPDAKQLWLDLQVRNVTKEEGKQRTENIMIYLVVDGVSQGREWTCGLEFDFANSESIYCRPVPDPDMSSRRMVIPEEATGVRVAYLPPMSGLQPREPRLDPGAVQVRLGEGRTAEVLRNLCWQVFSNEPDGRARWVSLSDRMRMLFGVALEAPVYNPERGELALAYKTAKSGARLDVSAAGRGMQQTLLLLAYLMANRKCLLLIDEPDAHLEILRQRQAYDVLTSVAEENDCQLVAATHSEVLMNEAADRDVLVAFIGKPHRIDDRGSQLLKALKSIGFEHYLQAEIVGWVLYLEGSTDLAILRAFAHRLGHPASRALDRPFVHYVGKQSSAAANHFHGLREAKPELIGMGIFDEDAPATEGAEDLVFVKWKRREIENYLCFPEVLMAYAERISEDLSPGPLFEGTRAVQYRDAMKACIEDRVPPAALRNLDDEWWYRVKATDEFLDPVFEAFFKKLGLPDLMRKTDYHQLARHVPDSLIDSEIRSVLDRLGATASRAASD